MLHLKQDIKDLKRLEQIVVIFFEEGLGYYVTQSKLEGYLPFLKRMWISGPKQKDGEAQAQRLRRVFERCGPTFVKLGQLLSLRPDLVPMEFAVEFEKLQDSVETVPFAEVKKIVEEELGNSLAKLFTNFSEKPIAAASMAQVHKAKLHTGEVVAVKVQRPGIREIIDTDLDILFFMASHMEKHSTFLHHYRPLEIVKEFALWTRKELNFLVEAQNAVRLKEELKQEKKVTAPTIYHTYCSKRVLTMEYIEGVKLGDIKGLERLHISREQISMTYFMTILHQALICGFFHADPHPANIFVQKNGKLVFLDCGIMGELSVEDRHAVTRFILSVPEKNPEKSLQCILALARDVENADLVSFKEETLPILRDVYSNAIGQKSIGNAVYQIISKGARYDVHFDPSHVLMAKAIYQAEGLGLKLNPKFKVAEGMKLFMDTYLKEYYKPTALVKRTMKALWSHKDLVLELPDHINMFLDQIERKAGEREQQGRGVDAQLLRMEWQLEQSNRLMHLGTIVILLITSAFLLLYFEGARALFGVPLSLYLFVAALCFIMYLLFTHKTKEGEEHHHLN